MKTKLACTLLLGVLATVPARGYEERRPSAMDDYEYSIHTVAEAFGFSTVPVPPETWICRDTQDGGMKCIALPPGTVLLFPHEPDSTGVR